MSSGDLIAKYRTKGILLDTNLLVLLSVGLYRRDRVPTFKRTRQYTIEDFQLVLRLVDGFARRITTPHILAETDNLTRQLPESDHRDLAATVLPLIAKLFEIYVPSLDAVRHQAYAQLGLTDSETIVAAIAEDALVVTDDFRLSNVLSHLGRDAININHIRPLYWT